MSAVQQSWSTPYFFLFNKENKNSHRNLLKRMQAYIEMCIRQKQSLCTSNELESQRFAIATFTLQHSLNSELSVSLSILKELFSRLVEGLLVDIWSHTASVMLRFGEANAWLIVFTHAFTAVAVCLDHHYAEKTKNKAVANRTLDRWYCMVDSKSDGTFMNDLHKPRRTVAQELLKKYKKAF